MSSTRQSWGGQNVVATGTDYTRESGQNVKISGHAVALRSPEASDSGKMHSSNSRQHLPKMVKPPQKLGGAVKSWLGKMAAKAVTAPGTSQLARLSIY